MIDIFRLTKADIGRWVIFKGYDFISGDQLGRIKSWDGHSVFVVYRCGGDWDNYADYTPEATHPSRLEFKEQGNA
jgi:hypothetical protein